MMAPNQATPPPNAPRIRAGEVSILIATRGRPEMLAEVFGSLQAHTKRKDLTALWLYIDEDDQVMRQAIEAKKFPDVGFPVHWHIGPQTASLGETHQALWDASGRASAVYMVSVDDARFDTPGWDEILRERFAQFADGVLMGFPHDPMTADTATYPIFGWRWLATLQRFFPGYFPFWYDDRWVGQVGRLAGRCVKLPILLYPIRGKGRTRRMRNLPFWTRFFQLMLEERKEWAARLIHAMHPEAGPARTAALTALETEAALLLKEEGPFSDVYTTFQEERFSDLSPEERQAFDAKYLQQEALAVARLIGFAQKLFHQKQYAEAMEFLDATHLSDLRVKHAQILKAECLRAIGRTAEASQLDAERLAAWPEMGMARKMFRLVGVVANDAKRLLVGMTEKGKRSAGTTGTAQTGKK